MKYYIGERVHLYFLRDKKRAGTIVVTKMSYDCIQYGLKCDDRIGLHGLGGICEDGYGIWVGEHDIRLLEPTENRT